MHSLKTTSAGPIFALAKPHDSVGKRTRNRIPKEERKTLVESFIKKHQKLNNGSFPSLSLTHKEVGGSFYTIREIVREIIQENRVLGAGDLILEGKSSENLQDQTLSSSILMDPVPPLSLPPNGFHSALDQNYNFSSEAREDKSPVNEGNINSIQDGSEEKGSDLLNSREVKTTQLFIEDVELLVHQSMGSTDISRTQFEKSCSEENDTKHSQTICDSFATKHHDKEPSVDNKDREFEEIPFIESEDTKPINKDERVNDAGAAMTEMVNMTKNTLVTTDLPAETAVEIFPVGSVTSTMESSDLQPSELGKVCEDGKGIEAKVETDRSTMTSVDVGEISSSTSAVPEENGTVVNFGEMPNHTSVPMEKEVEGADSVIASIHETKESSNGTLTTEQTMPTSGTEPGTCNGDIAKVGTVSNHGRNEVTSVEKATKEKEEKLDASESSSSQKGNIATLNRIKPESWKGESNRAGHETNPLLAVLKTFLTAFMKFWSE